MGRGQQVMRRGGQRLLIALALLAGPATAGAQDRGLAAAVAPCLAPHGLRDVYQTDLGALGWVTLPDDQRQAAQAMIADAFLPLTSGLFDVPFADLMTQRAAARDFWADLARNRMILWRDGAVLLVAGFRDDDGSMRVECWMAGPENAATDDALALIGQVWRAEGLALTEIALAASADDPTTTILISRSTPPAAVDPALAATDGLRTRITFRREDSP
jgi:hypothetical protein